MAVVIATVSYALTPSFTYGSGGYPGPDALPGIPTYGSYLGTIPVGGHSPVSYVCDFDAPNITNNSPHNAVAYINGHLAQYLPISTQFGCASFVVYVHLGNAKSNAPCGYAYASVNGGPWILVKDGWNSLLITGIKHYHHVGAYFPFFIPVPQIDQQRCHTTTTTTIPVTTIPGTTTPTTAPPTTIPGQTTTTAIGPTSTIPGVSTTSILGQPGTSSIPYPPNHSPGTVIGSITQIITLLAVVIAAAAAGVGVGELLGEIPEALVEEYLTEVAPGGGLPLDELVVGGAGTLTEIEAEAAAALLALDDSIPVGGGIPYGGLAPDAGAAEEGLVAIVADGEEGFVAFELGDATVLPGGGYPMNELWIFTFGLDMGEEDDQSGGGES